MVSAGGQDQEGFTVPKNRWLTLAAVVIGVALIVVAVVYWVEPARSLPGFFPGHEAGSSHHHVKHGVAALVVGLACLAFAWFQSGPRTQAK
jgi:drug/metabolite transporter (DMT)-like permease